MKSHFEFKKLHRYFVAVACLGCLSATGRADTLIYSTPSGTTPITDGNSALTSSSTPFLRQLIYNFERDGRDGECFGIWRKQLLRDRGWQRGSHHLDGHAKSQRGNVWDLWAAVARVGIQSRVARLPFKGRPPALFSRIRAARRSTALLRRRVAAPSPSPGQSQAAPISFSWMEPTMRPTRLAARLTLRLPAQFCRSSTPTCPGRQRSKVERLAPARRRFATTIRPLFQTRSTTAWLERAMAAAVR